MKNINPAHAEILKDLMLEISQLSNDVGSKSLEIECLEMGKEKYVELRDWNRVSSYTKRIATVTKELSDIQKISAIRMAEYKRLKEAAENQNLIEQFFKENSHDRLSILKTMKKLFRAGYGDNSRIMFILADNLKEAIKLANQKELEDFDEDDDTSDCFHFDKESVFEIDLKRDESEIIEDWSFETSY